MARAREMGLAQPLNVPKSFLAMCVAARENGYVITHKGDVHKFWEAAHDPPMSSQATDDDTKSHVTLVSKTLSRANGRWPR